MRSFFFFFPSFCVGVFQRKINTLQIILNPDLSKLSFAVNEQRLWVKKKEKSVIVLFVLASLFTQSETHLHIMEIETTAVRTTRTRRTIYNTVSMTIFYGRSTSFIVSAPIQTIRKKEKTSPSPRVCVQRSQAIIPSDVHEAENCQRLRRGRLGKKRRERCRNTERNEQLQLKPVPKIKGSHFPSDL